MIPALRAVTLNHKVTTMAKAFTPKEPDDKYPDEPSNGFPTTNPVAADSDKTDVYPQPVGAFDSNGSPLINFAPIYGPTWGGPKYAYDNADGSKHTDTTVKPSTDGQPTTSDTVAPNTGLVLNSIAFADSDGPTVQIGKSEVITVKFDPSNAKNKDFSAKSSNEKIATVSTGGSKVTVKGVKAGKATITITSEADSDLTDDIDVTVEEVQVTSIKMKSSSLDIDTGKSATNQATVSPDNAGDKSLTVSTSNDAIATASVDDNGNVTVKGVKAGDATITVKSKQVPSVSTTFKVTVKDAS